jgi:hypothetical protein
LFENCGAGEQRFPDATLRQFPRHFLQRPFELVESLNFDGDNFAAS